MDEQKKHRASIGAFLKNISLFYKIFYGIILIAISVMLIYTTISLFYIRRTDIASAQLNAQRLVNNINIAFKDNLDQMDNIISSITSDTSYETSSPSMNKILSTRGFKDTADEYRSMNYVADLFRQMIFLRPDFNSIYIYVSPEKSFSYSIMGLTKLEYNPVKESWFQKTVEANGNTVISEPHLPFQMIYDEPVISFSRLLKSSVLYNKDTDIKPVLLIDLTVDTLKKIISQANVGNNTGIIFLNNSGEIIYTENLDADVKSLSAKDTAQILQQGNGKITANLNGQKCLITYGTSNVTSWKITTVTKYSEIEHDYKGMLLFDIAILIVVIVLTIILSFFFSRIIFKPVKELQTGMGNVKKGNFETQLPVRSNDELGQLIGNFNSMTMTIKNLFIEKYVEEIARKNAEYSYLQSQINPHFIYNTLQIISSMAIVNRVPQISTAAKGLARVLRYSLDTPETVTVKDEIENLVSYLEIQKLRFGDKLNFEIEVDPEINSCRMIKLLLQPLVENAVSHGIEPKGEDGKIIVSGGTVLGNLVISVLDNGVGMRAEEVANLLNDINGPPTTGGSVEPSNHHSIGLRNINLRIKLVYGEAYGLEIESEKGMWTRVSVRIPKRREEELK